MEIWLELGWAGSGGRGHFLPEINFCFCIRGGQGYDPWWNWD